LDKDAAMLRTFVNGKIHQLKVTRLEPTYNGSCRICPELLSLAGIEPFERVEIYSMTSLTRIATYVFPGAVKGEFALNGGAALHFRIGDRVAVVTYRQEETFSGARCVIVDPADNTVERIVRYENVDDSEMSLSTLGNPDGDEFDSAGESNTWPQGREG
jgi:aspartate 1-decarboxylase